MTGDEKKREFDSALSRCITNWAHLETALADLFSTCLDVAMRPAAQSAFFSVVNFQSKLEMVNATTEFFLDEEHLGEWKSLYNRISRLSKKRNAIAHSQLWFSEEGGEYTLGPNVADDRDLYMDPASWAKWQKKKFSTTRLNELASSFLSASKEVSSLTDRARNRRFS